MKLTRTLEEYVKPTNKTVGYDISDWMAFTHDACADIATLAAENGELRQELLERHNEQTRLHTALESKDALIAELVEALETAKRVADEAHRKWDNDMRAGKLLIALNSPTLNYRDDINAFHAALSKAKQGEPS